MFQKLFSQEPRVIIQEADLGVLLERLEQQGTGLSSGAATGQLKPGLVVCPYTELPENTDRECMDRPR